MSFGPTRNNRGAGNAGEQLVQFRLGDAKRISDAVTWVEGHRRDRKPSVLPRAAGGGASSSIILGTHVGPWGKNQSKSVYDESGVYTVVNYFANVPTGGRCAFAKAGSQYILLSAECE